MNANPGLDRALKIVALIGLGFLALAIAREFLPAPRPPGICPDPAAHSGPFDPMTGRPRAVAVPCYPTVEQLDARDASTRTD